VKLKLKPQRRMCGLGDAGSIARTSLGSDSSEGMILGLILEAKEAW